MFVSLVWLFVYSLLLQEVEALRESGIFSQVINGVCSVPFVCPHLSAEPRGLQSISEVISVPTYKKKYSDPIK